MDRLESMSIVLAVAEAGSLAAAVRRLNTPPATASRKITELEEHLGTKLFDRSARRLVLTHAGSSYVAGLKRILADISEIERAASGEYTAPTGELVVTAPVGLGRIHLVPILAEFLSAYPAITVRLVLGDRILSLPEEHVDVALRLGMLPDSRLMALRLGSTSWVVCASPAYLALHGTPAAPEEATTALFARVFRPLMYGPSRVDRPTWRSRSVLALSSRTSKRRVTRPGPGSASRARSRITSRLPSRQER
jgi:DNA-binding transcriptional LysR family regulator